LHAHAPQQTLEPCWISGL